MPKINIQTEKFWLVYFILGILCLICGGNFMAYPLATFITISFFTGLYFIITGVVNGAISVLDRKKKNLWIVHLVLNIIVVLIGILIITKMQFAVPYLWFNMSIGLIIQAVLIFLRALDYKKDKEKSWVMMVVFAAVIAICGIIVLCNPFLGLSYITSFVTIAVILFGIYLLVVSFQLKPEKKK